MTPAGVWGEAAVRLRRSAPYRALVEALRDGGERRVAERLPVPAAAWIGELLTAELDRPLLAVVPHESDALAWVEASRLFGGESVYFPAPPLTPYQETDVSLPVRAEEAVAVHRVASGEARVVVCTGRALFRRLPSPEDFARSVLRLAPGDEQPLEELAARLVRMGYSRADLVAEVGDFALRGGVLDLFPPGETDPVRLDFFGDTLESVRRFDAGDQRSRERLGEIVLLPLSLYPAGPDAAARLAELLAGSLGRDAGREAARVLESLREGGGFPGWQHYLPLLADAETTLADLLTDGLLVALSPHRLVAEVEHHAEQTATDCAARRDHGGLAAPPEALEQPVDRVRGLLASAAIAIADLETESGGTAVDFAGSTTDLFHGQLPRFPREVETAQARGERLLVVSPASHRRRLEQWCENQGVTYGRGGVEWEEGELARGFRLPAAGVVVFGERQLFPRLAPRRPAKSRFGPFLSGFRDLKVGDYVVHSDHGIGQLVALRPVAGKGAPDAGLPPALRSLAPPGERIEVEVMEIAYDGDRRLLLPLSRLDQLQRYSGIEGAAPRLDKLGGTSWSRTKARVKQGLKKLAMDLLQLYAERQLARAPALPPDSEFQSQFEAAFEYEETEDQLEAIAAIKEDLARERPMDRLLCGDVGFGKTEVAMRAAFKAVDGGYQVAVLAPTTILADQHLETFRTRFEGFPVTIEMVSRGRTAREMRDIRERLASGRIDVLIGTHRLLSGDVEIPRLGLLVVDEEQRFGVGQKERLLGLKKNVHVLSMSATPVPRTLQLSLAGVRDLSVIETPPRDRMAVETAILPFSGEVVREAIEFELERSGQVFFVYNKVETIESAASYLRELLPELRLTIGHGQMGEAELARRMHAFKRGDYDLLLATTIIENGIDISNVNTMIVHRADRFGLAQLYQLRGRVGRSNQLAYCYLLVPSDRVLSEEARRRLAAIREFTELGAGFRVAARDLEIRGAGNLLGAEQSGHITALGIETYLKMLEDTVRELRGEGIEERPSVTIDLAMPMAIPTEYVADANLRMELYRRIASGEVKREEMLDELTDRFGPPPAAVHGLLEVAEVKRLAESLRVQSIAAHRGALQIRLRRDARIDVERLVEFVSQRDGASFSPSGVLELALPPQAGTLAALAHATLQELGR